jgi:hypothetical protein
MAFFANDKIKKIICAVVILAMVVPFTVSAPKKTEAFLIPIGDWLNTAFQAIGSSAGWLTQAKEYGLDTIAWTLGNIILQQITADVVDWINNGFEGNPAFIDNPEFFFLDLADQIAGDFIFKNEDLRFLCDPLAMGIDIRASISINHFGSFRYRSSCRLSQVFGNITNSRFFIRAQFKRGGWTGWQALTQVPANNIFGAKKIAHEEYLSKTRTREQGQNNQLNWGKGFLSYKKCNDSGLQGPRPDGSTLDCQIVTPGSFIEDQLVNVFGENTRKLGLADEITEIIGALIGQLMNKVFQGGLLSLSSRSSTQSNAYSARLRNGDPAAPFRRLTSEERSEYKAISDVDAAESLNAFDQKWTLEEIEAQNRLTGGGEGVSKADTSKAYVSQICTKQDQYGGNGSAVLAIDNSDSTYSSTQAGECAAPELEPQYPNHWWQIIFADGTYENIDEIRISTRSTSSGLGWPIVTTPYPEGVPAPTDIQTTPGSGMTVPVEAPYILITYAAEPGITETIQKISMYGGVPVGFGNAYDLALDSYRATKDNPDPNFALNVNRKIKSVRIVGRSYMYRSERGGDLWGVNLREVTFYKHKIPTVDLTNLKTTLTPFEALIFQPLSFSVTAPRAVKATYFPMWSNPGVEFTDAQYSTFVDIKDAPATGNVSTITIKDAQTNQLIEKTSANPLTYSLTPGKSYIMEVVAVEPGTNFRSKPTQKGFAVQSLGI